MKITDKIRFYRASGEFGFLSNLYKSPIEFEGRTFRCAEEAYQYGKPNDPAVAEWIVSAPKPHLCAAAAHSLFVFDITPGWSDKKVPRMARVIDKKFTDPELGHKLLQTWPALLTEESNSDAFWGIGKKGNGRNMLGILLVATRERLHRQQETIDRIAKDHYAELNSGMTREELGGLP